MKFFAICFLAILGFSMATSDGPLFPQLNITGALLFGLALIWAKGEKV